ncbi:MAG TPA: glycerol-3-phosphate 1-O-acyltransferase PlsY [Anaeromyxobacteraceae bacterium]|nr:glycerol-3-phosphate 1-O-acyltransferase PlsY [Anaeromyxobacteraceae bacterium]
MNENLLGGLLTVAAYLCGSIPFGVILTRLFVGVDVRSVGSGNIGATNVARVGGRKIAIPVFILDVVKAVVPILVARRLLAGQPNGELWTMIVAVAALSGHVFPVWLGFNGGKGVATGLGVFFVLEPIAAVAGFAVWIGIYLTIKISSIGSLGGTAVCAITVFILHGGRSPISWAGFVIGAIIFYRHRENIRRLITGEEKKV